MKFSLEQFHDVHWFISCDDVVEKYYKDAFKVETLRVIDTDDCDHNVQSEEKNSNWINILDMKETTKLESLIAGNNDETYSNNDINIIENSGGRKVLTINYVKNRNLEERVNKATTCWAINKTYSNIFEHKLNLF